MGNGNSTSPQEDFPRCVCSAAWVAVALLAACSPTAAPQLQGYIEGEYVRVAAPFAGKLQQLAVHRGGSVAAGAPLFALEREYEDAARREAAERMRAAEARLADLRTGKRPTEVASVGQQLQRASATRDLSAAQLRRQQELYRAGFAIAAALDDARTQLTRDEAAVADLRAQVATAQLPARTQEIHAAEAEAKAALEVVAQSEWRLAQRAIAAPVSGRVHDTYYVIGDWVPAGSPVASLLPPGNLKARFYVPEKELAQLKIGQSIGFACDGCPAGLTATVDFVSNRAEFTPPVLYSKENRGKLVYLVEARVGGRAAT
ncbi:MAG: HlyD family secretion protein, partial [Casimicrobiaceae bacterium]